MANTNKLIDLSRLSRFWDKVSEIIGNLTALTTSDKSSLVGAINEIASYTPVYGNTASDSIATFDTSLALPLQDCTIAINAVQESGTPTPSSPKLISGFTGANIKQFGANLISGDTYQVGANVVLLGESAGDTYSTYLKATTYTISFTRPTSKTFRLDLTDSNGVQTRLINAGTATSKTFTITTEGFYKFGTYISGGMTPDDIANVMLVEGSNVKPYTPYTAPTTTAISWQSEAGTVYGGSLDVTSGVLTVTWQAIDLGSLTWTYDAGSVPSNPYFFCQRDTVKVSTQNLLCSIYQLANVGVSSMPNYSMKSNNKGQVLVVNHDYSDENTFKTAMSGVLLVCEKLTPATYQLTPTQISAIVGTNNIFADTNGNTSVVYACSLKDYIDGQ